MGSERARERGGEGDREREREREYVLKYKWLLSRQKP